jgi:hypothetical protein
MGIVYCIRERLPSIVQLYNQKVKRKMAGHEAIREAILGCQSQSPYPRGQLINNMKTALVGD